MAFRSVALPAGVPGQMWLSSMPGRFEAWSAFESEAERSRLALVVCLTPRAELAELSPAYHAAVVAGRVPFRWLHLPMRNFGAPEDAAFAVKGPVGLFWATFLYDTAPPTT